MAKKLWGGRFKRQTDKDFFEFQKSIGCDYKLYEYDIFHSLIHVAALREANILNKREADALISALNKVKKDIKNETKTGKVKKQKSEDIHSEIHNRVEKKVGRVALKLHTLRSRNDQIVFDEKFYCSTTALEIKDILSDVLSALRFLNNKYKNVYIVGYTHTQKAQTFLFRDYLKALSLMFARDKKRLIDFEKKLIIYIGSGAFKGTSLSKAYNKAIKKFLKTYKTKKVVCVDSPADNVSDRDFIIEFLGILSLIQMHLSRLAEDFILYSTKEFNFLDLPEEFCTGSSLMPHKKNPDFLELVRGYTGIIYGNLISLLTTMKGLPFTYNRDMQVDKEPLFSSVKIIKNELKILGKFIKAIKLNKKAIKEALGDESLYATDLVEYLVKEKVPFAKAHEIVGKLIRYTEDRKCKIKKIDEGLLKKFSSHLDSSVIKRIFKG